MKNIYLKLRQKYEKIFKNCPIVAKALNKLEKEKIYLKEENTLLKKELSEDKQLKRILAHEIKNPLTKIISFADILERKLYESEEEKKLCLEIMKKSGEVINDLSEILYLNGSSKEQLKKKSEFLVLEDIAREHAFINNNDMKDEKTGLVGLHLKYNTHPYHIPIKIYANKPVMNFIWGTLFNNALSWAPPLSNITQAFRITKSDNLEIIMENKYSEKISRENRGLGEGIGIPSAKKMVKTMGGEFSTYKNTSQIRKEYDMNEWWGYKKTKHPEKNTDIFGIKITIPMDYLTLPKPNIAI